MYVIYKCGCWPRDTNCRAASLTPLLYTVVCCAEQGGFLARFGIIGINCVMTDEVEKKFKDVTATL